MLLRHWFFSALLLSSLTVGLGSASAATDPKLQQECIDAGLTTQKDCDALLKKLKKAARKAAPALPTVLATPAEKTPAPPAPLKPADVAPPAEVAPPAKPIPALADDCVAAQITTQTECKAFHAAAKTAARKAKSATIAPSTPPADVSPQVPSKSRHTAPANEVTAPSVTASEPAATTPLPAANLPLAKDCIAAGLKTQAECDAFRASAKGKSKGKPKPSDSASSVPPAPLVPSAKTGTPAIAVTPPTATKLAKDCRAAGLKKQADCDRLHASQQNPATPTPPVVPPGQPSDSSAPGAASKAVPDAVTAPIAPADAPAPPLAKDCVAAGVKTQADCDALHLIAKQNGKGKPKATPSATLAVPAGAQPLEVIPVLPKGVTQAQVAPLLDSAKQSKSASPSIPAAPATPAAPPPSSDKAAQADIAPAAAAPITQLKGQPIDPHTKPVTILLPPNVTVANQPSANGTHPPGKSNDAGPNAQPANPIGLSIGIVLQIGGNQLIVNSSGRDQYRIAEGDRDRTEYEQLSQGRFRETITRPGGVRIVTVYDRHGDILRRSRFDRDGREVVLAYFDDTRSADLKQWRDPGDDLPPLRLQVPVQDYVLDADQSDESQIQLFFNQPPVERVQRLYSISEVERSARLRDMLPRVELGNLTFDTGSSTLGTDQIAALSSVANAILGTLQKNPAETFLIEGHTDAVGSDASNLVLSDARAATVAQILTDAYHIPPENLATQGYGAHFLKVQTDGPERVNRRVTIRRITPLITEAATN